jgi:ABC-2 type transport system ATP-binding protein
MTQVIEVQQLGRVFNFTARPRAGRSKSEVIALDDVSLTVGKGQVFGLLGPNGAGKTTLIKILCTALLPTSGSARVLGFDVTTNPQPVRERIGIAFGGERGLYGRLTVQDNLEYWSAMYHVPRRIRKARIPGLLARVGLADRAKTPVDRLSKGMKQRMHLARALVNDPELVIMDEPTSGMDPVGAREFRSFVGELRHEGRTILLATHDMAEAEQLCDRIVLIDQGRIRGNEHPREIGHWLTTYERIEARGIHERLLGRLREMPDIGHVEELRDGWLRIHVTSGDASAVILKLLVDSGITSIRTSLPSLEEVYMHVIGERGLTV